MARPSSDPSSLPPGPSNARRASAVSADHYRSSPLVGGSPTHTRRQSEVNANGMNAAERGRVRCHAHVHWSHARGITHPNVTYSAGTRERQQRRTSVTSANYTYVNEAARVVWGGSGRHVTSARWLSGQRGKWTESCLPQGRWGWAVP
jgi:FAD/FMN-containing dehydrogenase